MLCPTCESLAQIRTNVFLSVGLSDVAIKRVPSYIVVNGSYLLASEGIEIESHPGIATAIGLEVQKTIFTSGHLYSGLEVNYRQTHLTHHNYNLFFYEGTPQRKHTFSADIEYDFLMVQVPIGVMVPLHSKFSLNFAIINDFVIEKWRQLKACDKQFDYQLVSLERRSTNPVMFELEVGATYQTKDYALRLSYTHGVNSIESKTDNAYNHLIPADLYFTGFNLSVQARLQALFSFNKE